MRLPNAERSQVVLIGTSSFGGDLHDLPAVANNVTDLVDVLTDSEIGGFDRSNCTVLLDEQDADKILDTLAEAAGQAGDVLLVYIATHALPKKPASGELMLLLPGTDMQASWWWRKALSFDDIREVVRDSPAQNRIVIVDCCHAGLALPEGVMGPTDEQFDIGGAYTLAAADPNSRAVAKPGERNTAFTGALLELLDRGVAGYGELLSLSRVFPLLKRRLEADGLPRPSHNLSDTIDGLAVVRNRVKEPHTAISDDVLALMASSTNTERLEALRRLAALHHTGGQVVHDQVRFHVSKLATDDSKIVSEEALRLLKLFQGTGTGGNTIAPKRPRRDFPWADRWWWTAAAVILVAGTLVLWSTGSPLWEAAATALPSSVLGYLTAVTTARWAR
ncbi:caspase family protein [Actinokineospora auranticolor]|uniref:Caspase domain-containing protein n=1 Tax=Actinokineospora auranticolor TaxID=155976 RepID=A0A2S6GEZ4_9PSEU|nr:caspase family protein [Actinokineospora auranticolor]PPK63808.1 caspase domain-containing protein [Actinokineospora auranticolor]